MKQGFHVFAREITLWLCECVLDLPASHTKPDPIRPLLGKRVEGDDKHKGLAIETFGMSMSAQSYTIREGSSYRTALQRMGDAHQNIGTAQAELVCGAA